ncbi:ribosomal protein L11 methyltransferase [Planctopirus ephydatiae]|uniref:Ribosomal protein L11 methyltransferase n=1 Tax=Planctopirus ephydatiae TaxID=2528019 RepID=A0A518GND2_9PLAN|nr:methyltransferase domain-containing protein [Planctopirus ephydatiae]QDV30153.1 ribosomal protein L11 methyltransferase [Planctopirus ephydatiae]
MNEESSFPAPAEAPAVAPPLLQEIRHPAERLPQTPPGLFEIPSGWALATYDVGGPRPVQLYQPADPDAFLESDTVLARHEADGYMPYWAYLWPAAVVMARVLRNAPWPKGTRLLELGAGVGLVGVSAAVRGDDVTITDYDHEAILVARENARLNQVEAQARQLDWRDPPAESFPVIIASEVLYEERNHAPILQLIDKTLACDGLCWIGDAGRTRAEWFAEKLKFTPFEYQLYDENYQPLAKPRFGRFQLFEIRRKQ